MDIYSAALEGNDYMIDGALDYYEFAMEGANIEFTQRYREISKQIREKYKEAKEASKNGQISKTSQCITDIGKIIDEAVAQLRKDFKDQSTASVAIANGILILKSSIVTFVSIASFIGVFKWGMKLPELATRVENGKIVEAAAKYGNTAANAQAARGQKTLNFLFGTIKKTKSGVEYVIPGIATLGVNGAMMVLESLGLKEVIDWTVFAMEYFSKPKSRRTAVDANKYQADLIRNLYQMRNHYYELRKKLVMRARKVQAKKAAKANDMKTATEALIELITLDKEGC